MPNIKSLKIICLCITLWFIAFSLQTENAFALSRYQLQIQVQQADDLPIAAASVRLFNAKGKKIGPKQKTDAEGVAGFYVPEGIYTARITYLKSNFWSPPYEVSHRLSALCVIPHKKITIKVQGRFQKRVPLHGVKVELFLKDGQRTGQKKRTDSLGQAAFTVPERPFKVRVTYRKQHFWSEVFVWQNQAVTIPMGHAGIHVTENGRAAAGAKIRLLGPTGQQIGRTVKTDADGMASLFVPEGRYDCLVKYKRRSHQQENITLKAASVTDINFDLSPLTVNLTADRQLLMPGEAVTLSWSVSGADRCQLSPDGWVVDCSGSQAVTPHQTTTYRLTASAGAQSAGNSATVKVVSIDDLDLGLFDDEYQGGAGLVGNTIRITNGNLIQQREDVRISSPHGMGLSLRSAYNSRSQFSGAMGYGWSHSYDMRLSRITVDSGDAVLKLMDQTGRMRYFAMETENRFEGMYHEPSVIIKAADGYIWQKTDGSRCGLSEDGRLMWIEDLNGNRLAVAYNPQGQISKVMDISGTRALSFAYDSKGLLTAVFGPAAENNPSGKWVSYEHDANQNLVKVEYADGSGFRYAYADPNDPHNMTRKRNSLNHLLNTWAFDGMDRVIQITDRNGRNDHYTYVNDTLVEGTNAFGAKRSYTLTKIGHRLMVSALHGNPASQAGKNPAIRWQYDSRLNLIQIEYATGLIYRYAEHDQRGKPGMVTLAPDSPHERIIRYTYHPRLKAPLTRREASLLGDGEKVTLWDYDEDDNRIPNENPSPRLGRLLEKGFTSDISGQVVPFEYVHTYDYNSQGQLLNINGPKVGSNDTTHFTYDQLSGDLLSVSMPLIGALTFSEYDAAGKAHLLTDVNGQSKRLEYDARGRRTAITHTADDSTSAITYNAAGFIETISDQDQVTYGYSYDEILGLLASIHDTQGNTITFKYDEQGNLTEKNTLTNAGALVGLKRWSFKHPDFPGRLWKEIQSDGSDAVYDYNSAGQILAVTDPNGHETHFKYDSFGRISAVTQPLDTVTRYGYDVHGHLAAVTDAEDHATTYTNDDLGRLVKRVSPDSGETLYAYDEAGNVIAQTDANQVTVSFRYDSLNRLESVHFPDPVDDIEFTYDEGRFGKGRRTGMRDAAGSTCYTYNEKGQVVEKTEELFAISYRLKASYTAAGRLAALFYPSGRRVEYVRDSNGRITGVQISDEDVTTSLVEDLTYHPFGSGLSGMQTGAGSRVANQSGACGCLTFANPGEDMEQQYHYDSSGNLIGIDTPHHPELTTSYTYDALNRLTAAQGPFGTAAYSYDKVGNRLSRTINDQTEYYSYESTANHLMEVSSHQEIRFTYDAGGNTTSIGPLFLYYDQNNRLMRAEQDQEIIGEYTYNGLGQRLIKKTPEKTRLFYYDLDGHIIAESLPDGFVAAEYIYLGNTCLAKVDGDTGALYYYLNDRLGTPQYLTNDAGMVVWEATYKPFGEAEVHPNSRVENNFRFPGQYYDKETDLHYNYHRYYDPAIGRYLRPDPIGLAGGINLFTYVKNNPVGLIDPKGLIWVTIERDYSAAKNTGIGFLNWLARKIGSGWQGGIPMSHPSEWERMEREIIQEWQHDKNNPCEDSKHTIGAIRRVKQKYIKKPHIPGIWDRLTTHYWKPPSPDRTYIEIPESNIINDFSWYEPL